MKSFKPRNAALVALLAAALVVVGVLVWPEPQPAYATDVDVHLFIDWGVVDAWDAQVGVILLDSDDVPIPGYSIFLQPDDDFVNWDGVFVDVPSNAAKFRIQWNTGDPVLYEWVADPCPIKGNIPWEGIDEVTHCTLR